MTSERNKKLLTAVAVVAFFGLWLFVDAVRWRTAAIAPYEAVLTDLRSLFPDMEPMNVHRGFGRVMKYLLGSGMAVSSYYLAVMLPERTEVLTGRARKPYLIAAAAVLALQGLLMLLSDFGLYRLIFPTNRNLFYGIMQTVILSGLAGLVLMAVTVICLSVRNYKQLLTVETLTRSGIRYGLSVVIGLLTGFMSLMLLQIASAFIPDIGSFTGGNSSWDAVIAAVVCAPILEEILFRGVMLGNMRKVMPGWVALVISSVFFGLFHQNLGQFLYTVLYGMVFGAVYLITKRIRYGIAIHLLINYLSVTLSAPRGKLPGILQLSLLSLKMQKWPVGVCVLLLIISLALIAGCLWLMNRFASCRGKDAKAAVHL